MKADAMKRLFSTAALLLAISLPGHAAQPLGQLVSIEGLRDNQLLGYGLVVGLNGSGDSTQVKFAGQSVGNLLKQFGVSCPSVPRPRAKTSPRSWSAPPSRAATGAARPSM